MIRVSTITSVYRGDRYLELFLRSAARQTALDRTEIVLVHNEPSDAELDLVRDFQRQHPGNLTHIVIRPVESLAASMNRAIRAAHGDLVTIWNVDDLRTDESIELQLRTMDAAPEIIATYGDYVVTRRFGSTEGRRDVYPPFDRARFTRGMFGSCYPMWRRSASASAGLFDEQLLQGADFDLFVRLAFNGRMRKTEGLLGYYLDEGRGLASRPGTLQPLERTVIQLRYGMYGRVDYRHFRRARRYRLDAILFDGRWHPVAAFVPEYRAVMKRRRRDIPVGIVRFLLVDLARGSAGRARRFVARRWSARGTALGGAG